MKAAQAFMKFNFNLIMAINVIHSYDKKERINKVYHRNNTRS